uniref:Uncharacterized protein n=1 Tax=Arion vulgaris TaxID=1028688 RepID=A0A0B7B100_9EUPU
MVISEVWHRISDNTVLDHSVPTVIQHSQSSVHNTNLKTGIESRTNHCCKLNNTIREV